MKRLPLTLLVLTMIISCKQETKTEEKTTASTKKIEEVIPDRTNDFPKDIAAVFSAHGGIHKFDQMNSLVFEITNPEGTEKHLTDLKTRHARIETDKFALGFDGKEAWLEQDSTYFKGNPRFYHNLMFYFYAMPFVLGDNGITFEKVDDLKVDDATYPGYKITYGQDIGDSPKDNYFLYYDETSKKMKFLGYTVTFFSKENSEKISLIEYADWNVVNGLLLPKTLKWRTYENGVVGAVKNEMSFSNASINEEKTDSSLFKKPIKENE